MAITSTTTTTTNTSNGTGTGSSSANSSSNHHHHPSSSSSSSSNDLFWEWAWSHYQFPNRGHVLDAGCATGDFWASGRIRKLSPYCRVTLTDSSEAFLARAKVNLGVQENARFEHVEVETLPYEARTFDRVVAHFVADRASSPSKAVAQIRRVLVECGKAYITTSSRSNLGEILALARKVEPAFDAVAQLQGTAFCEESAEPVIGESFKQVEKHVYEEVTRLTKPEPMVALLKAILGPQGLASLPEDFLERCAKSLQKEIQYYGFFAIKKRTALFVCEKSAG